MVKEKIYGRNYIYWGSCQITSETPLFPIGSLDELYIVPFHLVKGYSRAAEKSK
jgi:hypothetical protein